MTLRVPNGSSKDEDASGRLLGEGESGGKDDTMSFPVDLPGIPLYLTSLLDSDLASSGDEDAIVMAEPYPYSFSKVRRYRERAIVSPRRFSISSFETWIYQAIAIVDLLALYHLRPHECLNERANE